MRNENEDFEMIRELIGGAEAHSLAGAFGGAGYEIAIIVPAPPIGLSFSERCELVL